MESWRGNQRGEAGENGHRFKDELAGAVLSGSLAAEDDPAVLAEADAVRRNRRGRARGDPSPNGLPGGKSGLANLLDP